MEFEVTATTKSTRTKVFVKWNDNREVMYGTRFGKEDQAEQVQEIIKNLSNHIHELWMAPGNPAVE